MSKRLFVTLVVAVLIMPYISSASAATPEPFVWTISASGAIEIAGKVNFNPYERAAYIVVADLAGAPVQIGLAATDLKVTGAKCIAGLSCYVTWQGQLSLPCSTYDLLAVLHEGEDMEPSFTVELGKYNLGCDGEPHKIFIPIITR